MVKNWKDLCTKSTLLSLALGQLLSILVTFAGFTTSQLLKKGIYAPFPLSWLSYVLLALVNIGLLICRGEPSKDIKLRDIIMNHADGFRNYYLLLWADVFAKMFVMGAYVSASLTSIMLLNYWTIPCVMLFAWLFLKAKYGFQKLVGVAICTAGLLTLVLSDLYTSTSLYAFEGDLFLIVGATLYGVSIVFEETLVKKVDRVEIMAHLGINGSLFLVPIIVIDDRDKVKSILSSPEMIFLAIGFSIAMFLLYSGVSLLLKISGSKMLYLSLLTSNMWATLIQIFVYHGKVNWIYFVAFVIVTLGIIIYSREDKMNPNNGNAIQSNQSQLKEEHGQTSSSSIKDSKEEEEIEELKVDPIDVGVLANLNEVVKFEPGQSSTGGIPNESEKIKIVLLRALLLGTKADNSEKMLLEEVIQIMCAPRGKPNSQQHESAQEKKCESDRDIESGKKRVDRWYHFGLSKFREAIIVLVTSTATIVIIHVFTDG